LAQNSNRSRRQAIGQIRPLWSLKTAAMMPRWREARFAAVFLTKASCAGPTRPAIDGDGRLAESRTMERATPNLPSANLDRMAGFTA
jgi:hypothetical protein